jgi:Trypsin
VCAHCPQGDSGGPLLEPVDKSTPFTPGVQVGIVSYGYGCAQANAYAVNTRVACMYPWIAHRVPSLLPGPAPVFNASVTFPSPPAGGAGALILTLQASGLTPTGATALTTSSLPAVIASLLSSVPGFTSSSVRSAITDASVLANLVVYNAPLGLWNASVVAAFAGGLAADWNVSPSAVSAGCADLATFTQNVLSGRRHRHHRRMLGTAPPSTATPVSIPILASGLMSQGGASPASALATQLIAGNVGASRALGAWATATQRTGLPPLPTATAGVTTVGVSMLIAAYMPSNATAVIIANGSAILTQAIASGALASAIGAAGVGSAVFSFGTVQFTPAPPPPSPPSQPGAVVSPPPPSPLTVALPPPPPVEVVVTAATVVDSKVIGLAIGIGGGATFICALAVRAAIVAARQRREHMALAEQTIHRVRSKVLMDGLTAGKPMGEILSHASMKTITADELQAAAQACLAAYELPQAADGEDEVDHVPAELIVPTGGPRRSMVRTSASAAFVVSAAGEAVDDDALQTHLHRISMWRLSSTSAGGDRVSRGSIGGGSGDPRDHRLTTFDPLCARRISLMQEAALRRLSTASSTEWTEQDEAAVARMAAEEPPAPP